MLLIIMIENIIGIDIIEKFYKNNEKPSHDEKKDRIVFAKKRMEFIIL